MNLFSSEKGTIFKLTNAILLIWLIGAIILLVTSFINFGIKEPEIKYTYEEFQKAECEYSLDEEECKLDYKEYNLEEEQDEYDLKITILTSIANIIIIGGVIFALNKKKYN
ncbi:MAG: hypothetical protein PHN42_03450 [Bacilli bacterium]|nr:hypothetical protein [Bacilli bacterium]